MTAPRAGGLAVAVLVFASWGAARAADFTVDAGLRVVGPACPIAPLSVPAFVDSLRVELAGRVRPPGTTRVALAVEPCDPSTVRVRVEVTSEVGAPVTGRDVGLEDVAPEARPRALALVVAELVRGAELEGAPPAPPAVAVAPPPAPAAPPPVAPFAVGAAADALVAFFPSRGTTLWGGRLSGSLSRGRLGLALFAEAAAGERGYSEGDVALQSFGAGVAVGPRWVFRRLTVAPALVGALGWGRIEGETSSAGVTAGAGSALTTAVRARLAGSALVVRVASVRAFVEGGVMTRGFDSTVDGARAAGLSGLTLVAGLGLGL
jgi:hypothetical protein